MLGRLPLTGDSSRPRAPRTEREAENATAPPKAFRKSRLVCCFIFVLIPNEPLLCQETTQPLLYPRRFSGDQSHILETVHIQSLRHQVQEIKNLLWGPMHVVIVPDAGLVISSILQPTICEFPFIVQTDIFDRNPLCFAHDLGGSMCRWQGKTREGSSAEPGTAGTRTPYLRERLRALGSLDAR